MRKNRILLGLVVVGLLSMAQSSVATVLNFDDLSGYNTPVPSTYDGFNFSGWLVDSTCSGTSVTGACSVYPYQPESLPTSIFANSNSNSIRSVALAPFVFNGAYFTGYSGITERFDLYLSSSLVATSAVLTLNGSEIPAFLSSGYAGNVDTVVVTSNSPDLSVMDNFTFAAITVTSAPEPASLALLGLGLAGLGFSRRKKA